MPLQPPCPHCAAPFRLSEPVCPECGRDRLVAGRYQADYLLAQTPTSRTYGGSLQGTSVPIELTLYAPEAFASADARDAVLAGAERLRGLTHIGLPRAFAAQPHNDGGALVAREHPPGDTLADRETDALTLRDYADLTLGALRLLGALHTASPPAAHGDVHPGAIAFFSPGTWRPTLTGFDLAALATSGDALDPEAVHNDLRGLGDALMGCAEALRPPELGPGEQPPAPKPDLPELAPEHALAFTRALAEGAFDSAEAAVQDWRARAEAHPVSYATDEDQARPSLLKRVWSSLTGK